jgi:hypothetical protein
MRRLAAALLLLALPAWAQPVVREFKATVVGDALGWETHSLALWLVLPQKGEARLELYSPGFDPTDYRSALRGKEELGDEQGCREKRVIAELAMENELLRERMRRMEDEKPFIRQRSKG